MRTAVVLLNRDLRVHDHPALAAACAEAERVLPLFVFDDALLAGLPRAQNRVAFLLDSLRCLRAELRQRGGDLVIRRGDPVGETVRIAREVAAEAVLCSEDVSGYAQRRAAALTSDLKRCRVDLRLYPGITVVPPGELRPAGGSHYRVFTPYWRAWQAATWRPLAAAPPRLRLPEGVDAGECPALTALLPHAPATSAGLQPGGERDGRARMRAWTAGPVAAYEDRHDDLAADATAKLSAYLHFGCLSPLEFALAAGDGPDPQAPGAQALGAAALRRQLAWRDFHHQVTAAFPHITTEDYRPRGIGWHEDKDAFAAWCEGHTGIPIVDAGLRQLRHEGWMHNRARLIAAGLLTKKLRIDWRLGARHFMDWLADGDIANNYGNWQWVAGTGNDTRPNRGFNPLRQARRFDPQGRYVRRWVPELAALAGPLVHEPWRLPAATRRDIGYPDPTRRRTTACRRRGR
jgi:deoxyribodipyrimidine photo-lyase